GGNPRLDTGGVTQAISSNSPGGNMEGKETRFGPSASGVWAASTTPTSNGSVNSMHDSYTPSGGPDPPVNKQLGRDQPGGGRRRAERPAGPRDPGGVHRRPDGRANSGVPRQEDPGRRDQTRGDLHPGDAGSRHDRHRARHLRQLGEERVDLEPRRARVQRAA